MPIREIARRTGISRNTIKQYLRQGIVEPAFQTPDRSSKLDPYAKQLTAWPVPGARTGHASAAASVDRASCLGTILIFVR
jgi:transposase